MTPLDLTGRQIGSLTVIESCGSRVYGGKQQRFWDCICSCGKSKQFTTSTLASNKIRSCGCMRSANILKSMNANPKFDPLPGETHLKMWLFEEAERLGISKHALEMRIHRGKHTLPPCRKVHAKLIYVQPKASNEATEPQRAV